MSSFVEAREYLLGNLLAQNLIFEVPVYQRPFSWQLSHWEDLFNDIIQLGENQTHFIGALVVVPKSQPKIINEFHIVDGQQRLTTLFTWLIAIRDFLLEFNPNKSDELVVYLEKYLYLVEFEGTSKTLKPKLILGKIDNDYFQSLLFRRRIENLEKNSLILDCYNYFKEKTKEIGNTGNIWKRILEGISVVFINAYTNINAFRLFETLNDRGLELSAVDLIKNYLLMKLSSDEKSFEIGVDKWIYLYEKIKDFEPVRFLRRFYQIYFDEQTTERELYEKFCKKIEQFNPSKILTFLDVMDKYARIYNKMLVCNFDNSDIDRKLTDFKYIEVTQSFPFLMLLLSYYEEKKIDKKDLLEIFEAVENLHIRWGICGLATSRLDSIYYELCLKIKNFTEKNLKQNTIEFLHSKINEFVGDKIFEQSLLSKDVKPSERRTKYILWKLMEPSGEQTPNFDKIQVEHIMPQTQTLTWLELLSKSMNISKDEVRDNYAKYVNKIGNLTLIKGEWNPIMSNKPFKEKQSEYSRSEFKHTQELCKLDNWDFNKIEERTKLLAKLAIEKVWKTIQVKQEKLDLLETEIPYDEYFLLLETLKKMDVTREWLEYYSDLAYYIINKYGLDFQKNLMVYSIKKQGWLVIIINDRYVYTLRKKGFVGFILQLDFNENNFPEEKVADTFNYTYNKLPVAKWVEFFKKDSLGFPEEIINQWEMMIEMEVSRNYKSNFKKYNKLSLYKFFVDKNFRAKILDIVYGSNF